MKVFRGRFRGEKKGLRNKNLLFFIVVGYNKGKERASLTI